ncbi:Spo0B domain-containing protein [Paenibacillus ottowii]|uniref:Sporulation protein n=1 Tax=Paenibacillus ottowii TaxID=2315729 RepID=A0ABY3B4F5_9BACL|nr:Spo0B domain-containing protein [Paenibacillus ottowii]NEU28683.1 sporulation protein [Paenibacillus polymyxa]TQR97767.1 sporulation protein [Paenibacillus ottowii]
MFQRIRAPYLALGSILIPLVFSLLYPKALTIIILAVWAVAAACFGMRYTQKQVEHERKAALRSLERTAIATLNHHRHDWMNDLQVLYGYIRMNKHDKSAAYVETIKGRVSEDSKISKLGIPTLVFYLQSFRVNAGNLQLSVQVEEELKLDAVMSPEDGESLASAVIQTVRAYQYGGGRSSWGEVRRLTLYFGMDQNDVIVRFEGSDIPADLNTLKQVKSVLGSERLRTEKLPTGNMLQIRMQCQT